MQPYLPEGLIFDSLENKMNTKNFASLSEAFHSGKILEARAVVCDSEHNLIVDFGFAKGLIPRIEGAIGIEEGSTRDIAIISKVNKPVCFTITGFAHNDVFGDYAVLSRRAAQAQCMDNFVSTLSPGDIITARVTHLEPFGCFVDIGCGIASLIPIDAISISRISHPRDRFRVGQVIKAVVKTIDEDGRICLSHKELLGSWEENAALFSCGETVAGIIRSVEEYGVFIELTPNLAGLAESCTGVVAGQHASVYIKSLIPEKMKIKLIIVDCFDADYVTPPLRYFLSEGHLDEWRYSPKCCDKTIQTIF